MFLAIVSAHTLAAYLAREEATRPDGFVVEGPRSGGHNAPPRGHLVLDEDGQPIFGPRDDADFDKVAKIGLPFWLAGGYSTPELLKQAQLIGAIGVQVGTLFALSAESGFSTVVHEKLLTELAAERLVVRTDPLASPTGFPFKVASLPGTLSEMEIYSARPRLCDLGYLRVPYQRASGSVGYRCPGEPLRNYVRKGGAIDETVGRKCLCNGLMASVGLSQTRSSGYREFPLVTLGANLGGVNEMITIHPQGWTAAKVVSYLLQ
jgi:NAD(P)H-dependent flavin oxidoreductase YrpB (nitropropane dioxygenase family)